MNTAPPAALLASFPDADSLLAAARRARQEGYECIDGHSPFPVDGLAEALGFDERRVVLLAGAGFVGGFSLALLAQWWMNAVDYPLNVGGRPLAAWVAFAYPAFELACLAGAVVGIAAMLLLNHLPRPGHPLLDVEPFRRASQDRFFLSIATVDPRYRPRRTEAFLRDLGARQVLEVPP